MNKRGFFQSGHTPTLFSAFLYFDISFMVWVLLGPLAVIISEDFQLNAAQAANLVALPTLGGSILRLVLGTLSDMIGPKKTGQIGMIVTFIPLLYGWLFVNSLTELYIIALLLGVAGASFAAALPLASQWYPPQYQGLAMGIAGAGNSGTVFTTLFANRIAQYFGDWSVVFGLAMIPVMLTFIAYSLLAKDKPNRPTPKKRSDYRNVLKERDTWIFCFFYSVTFGGFVGLSTYLTIFFNNQYGLDPVKAGDFAAICVVAGSFFRPVGGWLADKLGGIRMLIFLFSVVCVMLTFMSTLPSLTLATVLLFLVMMCLGMGNGSVFQLVPQRFSKEIGIVTGIVGAAGGIGGFILPKILGNLKLLTGSFSAGFFILSGIAFLAVMLISIVQVQWKKTWISEGGKAKVES